MEKAHVIIFFLLSVRGCVFPFCLFSTCVIICYAHTHSHRHTRLTWFVPYFESHQPKFLYIIRYTLENFLSVTLRSLATYMIDIYRHTPCTLMLCAIHIVSNRISFDFHTRREKKTTYFRNISKRIRKSTRKMKHELNRTIV